MSPTPRPPHTWRLIVRLCAADKGGNVLRVAWSSKIWYVRRPDSVSTSPLVTPGGRTLRNTASEALVLAAAAVLDGVLWLKLLTPVYRGDKIRCMSM